jgi:hypothetical protein
LGPRRTA